MKAKFQGTPLFPKTKYNPDVFMLGGDFGREVLKEYNKIVESKYNNNENLRVLSESNDLIVGSNPFAVVVLNNKVLNPQGLRTATQADLELILKHRPDLNLKGTYEDTGLVLRSEGEPNSYLAGDLAKQLKARGPNFKYPVLIHLKDLSLKLDQDSSYGLAFNLKDEAEPIYVPILNSLNSSKFNSSDINKSTGLPKKTRKEGERYLYTVGSGLSWLYLSRNFSLSSNYENLAGSGSNARVIVLRDIATQKNSK